jgi:hypothetical protein
MTRGVASSTVPWWTVTVERHTVGDPPHEVWRIPASVEIICAPTARAARIAAVQIVHVRAGVMSWKPYWRETWKMTAAIEKVGHGD